MSHLVRPVASDDLEPLLAMARGIRSSFTNLPPVEAALSAKIDNSISSFANTEVPSQDGMFMFVLEDVSNGAIAGTCQIFARIGVRWPSFHYRIDSFAQFSRELNRTMRSNLLVLSTDLDGSSEVGGLYLNKSARSSNLGALVARSRYLFIGMHRPCFSDETIAELRGAVDDEGESPFWQAVGGRFFDMSFREADAFNALNGNQFIADLMPRHPIYSVLLPEEARNAMGRTHSSGTGARHMLEKEGFTSSRYIDIFDGGPVLTARTNDIATVKQARSAQYSGQAKADLQTKTVLAAVGRFSDFRVTRTAAFVHGHEIWVDGGAASILGINPGDTVTYVEA